MMLMSQFQKTRNILVGVVLIMVFVITGCSNDQKQSGPSANKITNTSVAGINNDVLHIKNGQEDIYGHLYTAKNHPKKMPIAIVSHGLGGNYQELGAYAHDLAKKGYLVYAFDFPGGSTDGQSTGLKEEQMSLTTEVNDLMAVKSALQKRTDVKKHQVLLIGGSQGGVVSSLMASQHPQDIQGLALMYPAFSMSHDAKVKYQNTSEIPTTTDIFGFTVGKDYYSDLLRINVVKDATKFDGPVLIVHGNEDSIVPIKYVGQAVDNFPNAQMNILDGAGHGFDGKAQELAQKKLNKFVKTLN